MYLGSFKEGMGKCPRINVLDSANAYNKKSQTKGMKEMIVKHHLSITSNRVMMLL